MRQYHEIRTSGNSRKEDRSFKKADEDHNFENTEINNKAKIKDHMMENTENQKRNESAR